MDAAFAVTVRSQVEVEGQYDDYGNAMRTPVDRSEPVYGWAPAGSAESDQRNEQVVHDIDLYVPATFTSEPTDKVRLVADGEWFTVEGRLEDFTHGPFGYGPGGRVDLKRVTG